MVDPSIAPSPRAVAMAIPNALMRATQSYPWSLDACRQRPRAPTATAGLGLVVLLLAKLADAKPDVLGKLEPDLLDVYELSLPRLGVGR